MRPIPTARLPRALHPEQEPDEPALRLGRRPVGPEREREEQGRQEQRDRQGDVDRQDDREQRGHGPDCTGGRSERAVGRRAIELAPGVEQATGDPISAWAHASSATHSPSADRPTTSSPAAANARGPRARGRRRSPTRAADRPAGARPPARPARPTRTEAMRLARTRSNGGRRSAGCPVGRDSDGRAGSGGRSRGSPRSRSDRCRARPAPRRRTARPRSPGSPSRSRRRGRGCRRAPPRPVEQAAIGPGLDPGQAQPGRRMEPGPERHPGVERDDDVVGRPAMASPGRPDHEPAPDPEDREVGLPGVGPVLLVDDPRLERADRAQAERAEMAERDLGARRRRPGRRLRSRAGR